MLGGVYDGLVQVRMLKQSHASHTRTMETFRARRLGICPEALKPIDCSGTVIASR